MPHVSPYSDPGTISRRRSVSPPPTSSELFPGFTNLMNCNGGLRADVGVSMKEGISSRQVTAGKTSHKMYGFLATRQSPVDLTRMRSPPATFEQSLEADWGHFGTLFDPLRPKFPSFKYMQHGADLFFDNLGPQFPFLRRQQVIRCAIDQTLPAGLANGIVGLGLRFSPSDRSENSGFQLAEPFIDMAKELTISVVCQPSFETLHSLLLLAWCEYGRGHEAGLLSCRTYAVQMALDVGLGQDANVETIDTEQERSDLRATWWSVTTIDIISSWVTGTQALLNLQQHDTQPPTASYSLNHIHTLPFDWLRDLLGLRDRLLVVFNSSNHTPDPITHDAELISIQTKLTDINSQIPPSLQFNLVNLCHAMQENRQTIFMFLHLMLQCLTMMVNSPSLLRHGLGQTIHGVHAANMAAQSIGDILALSELLDSRVITSNPFLDYPLALASRMFLMESGGEFGLSGDSRCTAIPFKLAMDSFRTCIAFLSKHSQLWGNVKVAETVVENKYHISDVLLGLHSAEMDPLISIQRIHDDLNELDLRLTGGELPPRTSPHLFEFTSWISSGSDTAVNLSESSSNPLSTKLSPAMPFTSGEIEDSLAYFLASYNDDCNLAGQDFSMPVDMHL